MVPNWKISKNRMAKGNVTLHYGADGTGDIYKLSNIEHFVENVGWRTTYFGMAAFCTICISALALMMRRRPPQAGGTPMATGHGALEGARAEAGGVVDGLEGLEHGWWENDGWRAGSSTFILGRAPGRLEKSAKKGTCVCTCTLSTGQYYSEEGGDRARIPLE
jgi:hypothetical protein